MASSRDTLNTPDWRDVATALTAFEEILGGRIVMTLTRGKQAKPRTLFLTAVLLKDQDEEWGPLTLASASVSIQAGGIGATDTELLSLLYELDRDYYRRNEADIQKTA